MPSLRKRIQKYIKKKTGIDKLEKALGNRPPSSVSINVNERKQLHELDRLEQKGRLTPAKKRKKIGGKKVFIKDGKFFTPVKE